MKRIQLTVFISFCLILNSFTLIAKKEELRLELYKGQNFTYVITQENTMQERPEEVMMYQKMSLKISQSVVDRLMNGNYLIEAAFKTFSIEFKNQGRNVRYHSDTVDVRNKLYKPLNFFTEIKLSYEVSPEGVVSNLKGFETIKKKLEEDDRLPSMLRSFGNEQFLLELYNYIPAKTVEKGSKWVNKAVLPELMNHPYDIQYIYREASEKGIKIEKNASFTFSTTAPIAEGKTTLVKENGTQKGTIVLDIKSRMPLSSEMVQEIEISTDQTSKNGDKIPPAHLITKIKMERVKK